MLLWLLHLPQVGVSSEQKRLMSPSTVKYVLTLMYSCGMYDYSGTWSQHVGVPAKSGVAGVIQMVFQILEVLRSGPHHWIRGKFCKGYLRYQSDCVVTFE